uniref:Large ribosomal subunit protein uL22 n=1 Tax=uncultured Microgenomates bacterium Rifle_16ft_4_minimus_38077 TaxID=1665117 RepID=A0A0H4T9Q0_9BACT|nr:50S ribosomal protein L22, large subunit ribosomal protein L22 [uncultured Microgenomates bacterium Rifle_16ft_4_minimus_38077]
MEFVSDFDIRISNLISMEIKAIQKYIRMSPRKLRLVATLLRKMSPSRALEVLPHLGKRAAEPLRKVINTAVANAKVKKINESDLVFKEIQINEGPRLKRGHAGARGIYKPYQRKMSHIRVVLTTRKSEIQNTKSETMERKSGKEKITIHDSKKSNQKITRKSKGGK